MGFFVFNGEIQGWIILGVFFLYPFMKYVSERHVRMTVMV